jgi:nucleotide-binding universal stress UspA family protein
MAVRQLLLPLPTYPDRAPDRTLEGVCRLAQLLRAGLTAHVSQLNGDRQTWPPVMGAFPLDFPGMMQELVTKSEVNAAASCKVIESHCSEYGVKLDLRRALTTLYAPPSGLVDLARLHDLLVLPVPETDSFDRSHVEPAIFQSGRPVILMPSEGKQLQSLDRVLVAWDYSREAARALADALPVLRLAREVDVVIVFGEKQISSSCVAGDLDRYLGAHQVRYRLHQLDAKGKPVSELLLRHAAEVNAGMLVMGAYGHGRMREFILGGTSRGIIHHATLPVLLSH